MVSAPPGKSSLSVQIPRLQFRPRSAARPGMLLSRFGRLETERATAVLRRLLRAGGSARSGCERSGSRRVPAGKMGEGGRWGDPLRPADPCGLGGNGQPSPGERTTTLRRRAGSEACEGQGEVGRPPSLPPSHPEGLLSCLLPPFPLRSRMMRNWGLIGGVAAVFAAGLYVLWGPMAERKRRRKGEQEGRPIGMAELCKANPLYLRIFFNATGLVPGLLNLGNTCFMNSLLQGLSACPSLIQWLEGFAGQNSAGQSKKAGQRSLSLTLLRLLKGRNPFARP